MKFIKIFFLLWPGIFFVSEITPLPESAVSIGVVVPAFFNLECRLVHGQLFDSVSKNAILSIGAKSQLTKGPAEFNFVFTLEETIIPFSIVGLFGH